MSISLCKMIETRDKNGKWHLIQWNTIPFNGNEARTDSYTICGLEIRDALDWEGTPHNGIPEDISEGAEKFVNKWREEGHAFGESTSFFYMYLCELYDLVDKRYKNLSEQRKKYEEELKIEKITNQLNRIEDFIYNATKEPRNISQKGKEPDDDSDFDSTAQYLEEEFMSAACLESEINNLYTLAREISGETYIDFKDVRIIMWYI